MHKEEQSYWFHFLPIQIFLKKIHDLSIPDIKKFAKSSKVFQNKSEQDSSLSVLAKFND